ncbi:MAG: aldolase/citrate lyase family protein [Pseudomonadota bacterium]|nr:aldolase/citrate lyase family protein [Pseudomonadota bacterium]
MTHKTFTSATPQAPSFGGWVTIDSLAVVEHLALVGFDYIGIDTQHSMIDIPTAAKLLYALPAGAPPSIVRVPSNDHAAIGRILDCGADGVIVPMINTAQDAAAAVQACRYSPSGSRSFGPIRTHIGRDVSELQERAACLVMVETEEAVRNIDSIVRTPGITGVYLGPADLAVTMGLPPTPRPMPQTLREAVRKVAKACREAGVTPACHGLSAEHIAEAIADGYSVITLTADKGYLRAGAAALLNECRKVRP